MVISSFANALATIAFLQVDLQSIVENDPGEAIYSHSEKLSEEQFHECAIAVPELAIKTAPHRISGRLLKTFIVRNPDSLLVWAQSILDEMAFERCARKEPLLALALGFKRMNDAMFEYCIMKVPYAALGDFSYLEHPNFYQFELDHSRYPITDIFSRLSSCQMEYCIRSEPETAIELCFEKLTDIQKLIMAWLAPDYLLIDRSNQLNHEQFDYCVRHADQICSEQPFELMNTDQILCRLVVEPSKTIRLSWKKIPAQILIESINVNYVEVFKDGSSDEFSNIVDAAEFITKILDFVGQLNGNCVSAFQKYISERI